ncbi:MAG TPA: response regulator transcription factor [Acidimicrobiales bacterium]|jgi:DNA-binding NarL/FixJ family response regulator|nr:response regulator transcription factor [Acidimicrobiales bacterium]
MGNLSAAPIRVAVVDDHIMVSEMLALSISKEKDLVLVDVAGNMADALDLVRRDRPDVVLVNYRLPDADGVDVVRKILEEFPDTRVVMLSSSVDSDVRAQSFGAGCVRYLGRDRSIRDILTAVRSAAHEDLIRSEEFAGLLDEWSSAPRR